MSGLPAVARSVVEAFIARHGHAPRHLVRAPGRVNLIGEHTDYNEGFVLPVAIDRAVWIALDPRDDGMVEVESLDQAARGRFAVDRFVREDAGWLEYVRGPAWALAEAGHRLTGWTGVLAGDVPQGAGLSSSAALELAVLRAFAATSGFRWTPTGMARVAQQAENAWVGMRCGIMDQLSSAAGVAGHALLIDCRSLAITPVAVPEQAAIVILDTGTRRGLVASPYNARRAQCESAAAALGVPTLRDVTPARFLTDGATLDPEVRRRARHVVGENARTIAMVEALERGDLAAAGRLMDESHQSLRDDFEVSSDALNAIVTIARRQPGCFGARMTGAGFAGCAVALVDVGVVEEFVDEVGAIYAGATGLDAALYVTRPQDGASEVPVPDSASLAVGSA